jgi:hypothetical protein
MSPSPVPASPAADHPGAPDAAVRPAGRRAAAHHALYLVPPFPFSGPVVGAPLQTGGGGR